MRTLLGALALVAVTALPAAALWSPIPEPQAFGGIEALLARIVREGVTEVILALNADVESDATASFIHDALAARNVRVTRLARGIPAGSGLAYADHVTLARAIEGRQAF